MSIFGGILGFNTDLNCQLCGCRLERDAEVIARHEAWHKTILEIIHRVVAPEMSDEEWAEACNQGVAEYGNLREADITVRAEEIRAVWEQQALAQQEQWRREGKV